MSLKLKANKRFVGSDELKFDVRHEPLNDLVILTVQLPNGRTYDLVGVSMKHRVAVRRFLGGNNSEILQYFEADSDDHIVDYESVKAERKW